jgi:hypothetical protein
MTEQSYREMLIEKMRSDYFDVVGSMPLLNNENYWQTLDISTLLIVAEKWSHLSEIRKGN